MKSTLFNPSCGLLSKLKSFLLPIILLVLSNSVFSQTLTQSGFVGVTVPQYMSTGTANRMPVMFRATVTGLAASTAYKYYVLGATNSTVGGGTVDFNTNISGAGNPILVNATGTSLATTAAPSLVTIGATCETFTTDASGNYTGWFGFVNTGNARFTAGNQVYPTITLGLASGTVVSIRRALDVFIIPLLFATTATANSGTFLKSTSATNSKNFAIVYNNASGTGRPISIGLIENIGVVITSVPAAYSTAASTWNVIIPNSNASGVQRIENRNISNTLLGCAIDSDGIWPTGSISTVNPIGGTTTPIVIASADAPLISCAGTTLVSATGTLAAANTTYGTASANTTFIASGSGLTSDITITAPTGYEISQTMGGTFGFASTQILTQTAEIVANTTIYVRIAATTTFGTYSGNVTCAAAGATTINVATAASTVAKKTLTISGATADNKIYDRTTAVTFTGGTLSGMVNADAVTLTTAGTFNNALAANAKPITANFTISGTNSTSYIATQPTGLIANITAKDIIIAAAAIANKIYDGNTTAILTGTLNGVIAPDNATLTLSANFDSPFAGTAIAGTSTSSLVGADIANYNLVQPTALVADITPKALTIASPIAGNKLFDGNTTAVLTGTLAGVVAPDDVTLTLSATFASAAVGLNIPVTSTSTISGADIANYTLTQPAGLTANISAAALLPQTITFSTIANSIYGNAPITLNATSTSGLAVTYASSDLAVATVLGNVVTIVGVGPVIITASQTGDATYDAASTVNQTFDVNPKEITFSTVVGNNKVYDGQLDGTFTATLDGVVPGDVINFTNDAIFLDPNVATAIPMGTTSVLSGVKAGNYNLVQIVGFSANITPKPITVTGAIAANKVYNGSAIATISGASLVGVLPLDVVTVSGGGTFISPNVGVAVPVITSLFLSGAQAGNYSITQPTTLSANITPAPLTITGLTGGNKVYDRLLGATLTGTPSLVGVIGADDVTVGGAPIITFANKNVGTAKPITVAGYALTGAQAGNYSVAQPTGLSGNITKLNITLAGAIAQNKDFDGTTVASITGTLTGVIALDVVTLVGTGSFASSAIANGIVVTANCTLAGTDNANYSLTPQPTGLTANIVPGPTVLAVGDLSILGFNFNTQDAFNFVTWVDLLPNTLIKFTDNGFIAATSANAINNVRGGENFVIWKNSGALIPAGTVISITDNAGVAIANSGSIVSGTLNGLAGAGDNIFAYQGAALTGANPDFSANSNPTTFNGTILFGLFAQGGTTATSWLTTGVASSNTSYLPTQLNVANGNIVLAANATRGQYSGSRANQTSMSNYRSLVNNNANWTTGATTTGTIVLNNTNFTLATPPTASLLSGTATICAGDSTNLNVAIIGGTSPFTIIYNNGVSNVTVSGYVSGTAISVSPAANTTYTLISVTDSNSLVGAGNSGSAIVTINIPSTWTLDADNDGYGAIGGATQLACVQPVGYAALTGDCNDTNANVNPGKAEVLYNGIDDNCDGNLDEGFQLKTKVQVAQCGSTLPLLTSTIYAQDVSYSSYRFRVTNTTTNAVQTIVNVNHWFRLTSLPVYDYGQSYSVEIEIQRAGVWLGYYGAPCIVSTPAAVAVPGVASLNAASCGATMTVYGQTLSATLTTGVTGFQFRISGGTQPVETITRTQQWFTLAMFPTVRTYGETYTVEVAVKTTGAYSAFGPACSVTLPSAKPLTATSCGAVLASRTNAINTTVLAAVTKYRFQVTDPSNQVQVVDRVPAYFNLSQLPSGYTVNTVYSVKVAVETGNSGVYSAYSTACNITTPATLTAKGLDVAVSDVSADVQDFKVIALPNPFTTTFGFDIQSFTDGQVAFKVYDMIGKLLESREVKFEDVINQSLGENYPAGVYSIIVSQGDNNQTLRVVKR